MHRRITRRDFLNGVAVTAGAAMMPWDLSAAGLAESQPQWARKIPQTIIRPR